MHAMRRALSFPTMRLSPARGLTLGLVISLAFLLVGDRGARAITVNPGIDPLAILDLQVKPNVLFIIDTSGSMKWPTDTDNFSLGDDDPGSRAYQAKHWLGVGLMVGLTFLLHKIEAYYLNPHLTARHVPLPGFVLIVNLVIFEHLFGFAGLFLSFPSLYIAGKIRKEFRDETTEAQQHEEEGPISGPPPGSKRATDLLSGTPSPRASITSRRARIPR